MPSTTSQNAPQHYDASRNPVVLIQDSAGNWSDQPYELWFADLASQPSQGCGNPQDFTGWSQDINAINGGNPDAVRVVMRNVDMSQPATSTLLDVRVPMVLGP